MALICAECGKTFTVVKQLTRHLRSACAECKQVGLYRCGAHNCFREYSLLNSLRRHIVREHCVSERKPYVEIDQIVPPQLDDMSVDQTLAVTPDVVENVVPCDEQIMLEIVTKFVSHFYANVSVPRSVVKSVICNVSQLVSRCLDMTTKRSKDDVWHLLKRKLGLFNSEYKCFKMLKSAGTFIPPQEVVVGHHIESQAKPSAVLNPVSSTMQIIPLDKVLKRIFTTGNILNDTVQYISKLSESTDGGLTNFIQGEVWSQYYHEMSKSKMTLPLIVYYDDFETGNPLGSHSGVHKLGGVYVSIPCLPPMYQSKLDFIFLFGLFHTSDRETLGNQAIFQPLISLLNKLYYEGIQIETPTFNGTITFQIGALVGDNLGLHSMLGFVESFSANYPCRICKVHKKSLQTNVLENESLIRTTENYQSDLQLNNCTLTGIKEECVWLSLANFDIFQNVGVDVMHDILEGCARYIFPLLINHIVKETTFLSLETLNDIIFAFDYGPDSSSKPRTLSLEANNIHIRMSASEMLTFIRYFGLMVGHYLPSNYPMYDLYIALRQLTDALLSRVVRPYSSDCLQVLISELNELYIRHSRGGLKPKFHFLTHYHKMMDKFGPLSHIWSMRFEAKHRISKFVARSTSNRLNLCKTVAIRNQLYMNNFFLQLHANLIEYDWGRITSIPDSILLEVNRHLADGTHPDKCASWLKVNGELFRQGTILTIGVVEETNLPTFGIVTNVLKLNKDALFRCKSFETVCFDWHYQSYEVVESNNITYIRYSDLFFQITNHLNKLPNRQSYITVRHSL